MQTVISSEKLTAVIDSFGAELHSVKDSGGTEYLWQADPAVWKRHAPVLFPFICNTDPGVYTVDGKQFRLANHGFARDNEFALVSSEKSEAEFVLRSSEDTKKLYPYDFELYLKYSVSGNRLTVSYRVKNTNGKAIRFFIGGHPAFRVPINSGESFEDYYVEYEKPETIVQELKDKKITVLDGGKTVPLSHELFANDVFMKDKPNSSWVALVNKNTGKSVKLHFDSKGCIAVWSTYSSDKSVTEKAEFVCLEPWSSVPVYLCGSEELTEMKNAVVLDDGKEYIFSYVIEIE